LRSFLGSSLFEAIPSVFPGTASLTAAKAPLGRASAICPSCSLAYPRSAIELKTDSAELPPELSKVVAYRPESGCPHSFLSRLVCAECPRAFSRHRSNRPKRCVLQKDRTVAPDHDTVRSFRQLSREHSHVALACGVASVSSRVCYDDA